MATKSAPTTTAIYARFSTERQDARSIDDQTRRCRALAAQRGLQVVDVYGDEAVSGTHTHREGLQRLLADAARRRFRTVLVDDLSRLSRDLGDMWSLVFGQFVALDVVVVDVMTGISSDQPAARMTFGAMGLVSDVFVQMVKAETHRGLEGRALAGFHTGGRTYGFATVVEPNPTDPTHPRRVPVVEPTEAQVVRQVFEQAARGDALRTIADQLNQDGVAAPHDGGKGNKGARGWGHSTVRAMLANDRYTGVLRWNATKWVRMPGKKTRRRLARPEAEHVVRTVEELRIVPADLWDAVQTRFRKVPERARRRPKKNPKVGSLFSGLMRCGSCAGAFVVVGRSHKAGRVYQNLGCGTNRSRGEAVCANKRTLSERKVVEAVQANVRALLTPGRIEAFVQGYRQRMEDIARGSGVAAQEAQLRQAEKRVTNLAESLAKVGHSEALVAALQAEETKVAAARAQLAQAQRQLPVLHPRAVEGLLRQLLDQLDADPAGARGLLLRHMQPLTFTPVEDGYHVQGAFALDVVLGTYGSESATGRVAGACYRSESILLPFAATVRAYLTHAAL